MGLWSMPNSAREVLQAGGGQALSGGSSANSRTRKRWYCGNRERAGSGAGDIGQRGSGGWAPMLSETGSPESCQWGPTGLLWVRPG